MQNISIIDNMVIQREGSIPVDMDKLAMRLEDVNSPEDLERWRQHNVEVAAYLANTTRDTLFEEGTAERELFLRGDVVLPQEIQESIKLWDSIFLGKRPTTDFTVNIDTPQSLEDTLNLEVYDENHPRIKMLQALKENEEISSSVIVWLADYLGVPLIINYTADYAQDTSGNAGHAQALTRTPYQDQTGRWVYDIMDPMRSKVTKGIVIEGCKTKDDAYEALGKKMIANTVGHHLLADRVEFNLLEKMERSPIYDLLIEASVSTLQQKDTINCQFMSLLIQAYLWSYYGPIKDMTNGTIPNLPNIGAIISRRFQEVFNSPIKNIFDAKSQIVPETNSMIKIDIEEDTEEENGQFNDPI